MTDNPLFTAELLTPPGIGAVSVILVNGTNVRLTLLPMLRRRDGTPFPLTPKESPQFAMFSLADTPLDTDVEKTTEEVVLYCRDHDTVEIHCHGGVAVCGVLLRKLESAFQKF